MSDADQRPASEPAPDRPADVEELMALLERLHADLARDGTISPALIDAPAEIERLVDGALDSQLDESDREQLRVRIEEQGQPTDAALREVLADRDRERANGDAICDGGRPECTDQLCDNLAEYALWMGDQFSRVRSPEDPDLKDGDLSPYICEDCLPRYKDRHGDHGEFVPPVEKLVTDGGEDLVWVRSATDGKSRTHYHTDKDCHLLDLANDTVRKPLDVLADDIQECRRCAGAVTRPSGGPSTTVSDRLEAMDAGDLDNLIDGDSDTLISDGGHFFEVVEDPEPGSPATAGVAVRYRPDARAGERVTIEQLWPDGDAEPCYIPDRSESLSKLIHSLMSIHLRIMQERDSA